MNTGILLDCGLEFLNMENYTGAALHDSNYVSINDWRSIYGSLLSSQFNGQISFTDFPTINAAVDGATGTTVPFVSLHYNYQVLRPDAVSSGLMYSSNDQLYDVAGRPYSPYLTKAAFAIAPAKDHIVTPDGWVTYNFPANLIYGNTGTTISQLKIDLGDGTGLRTVQQGQAFNTRYSSGGYKNLTYQVTYTDNTVNTGHSRIYVEWQQDYYSPGGHESMFFHTGTGGTVQINTGQGIKQAFLQVRLSDQRTGTTIRKPLIVVEGIDFWRITSPNDPDENIDVTHFLDRTLFLGGIFPNGNLRDALDGDGYDIIYIDFEDGVDALENNSALVRAAITWVNGQKQALDGVMQQNVVLGISMGGVLARHALRTMEVNNIPHDARLYISMDSPHQGANFPVSLQAMVKHLNRAEFSLFWGALPLFKFKDAFPGIELAKQILDAPATKQLLTYRIGDGGSLPIDNFSHDSFYSDYRNLGYPALTRNIAISNGSECGTPQAYGPLATIFKQEDRTRIPWIFDAATSWIQTLAVFTNRPLTGLYAPLGIISTKTNFIVFFEAKALPDKSSQLIYKGQMGISRKVLGLINVNANITNKSVNSTSSMLPLDNAPGGDAKFFSGAGLGIPADFASLMQVQGFNFIPTVSSLDIGGGNVTINTPQLMSAYSISNPPASPYNTPFARFVTAVGNNEDHVTFFPRNGDFLLKELQSNYTLENCNQFCSTGNLLSGPDNFCTSQDYSINVPSGGTVSWTASGAFSISGSSTSATVTLVQNSNGSGTLMAVVSSPCGSFTVSKQIGTGTPKPGPISWTYNAPPNRTHLYVDPVAGATQYMWYVNGVLKATTSVGYAHINNSGTISCGNSYYFGVKATGPCGTSEESYVYAEIPPCEGYYQVWPNPSSSVMTVSYKDGEKGSEYIQKEKKYFSIRLYDNKSRMLRSGTNNSSDNTFTMDIQDIPDGTYFLHIIEGKKVEKRQIIIQH